MLGGVAGSAFVNWSTEDFPKETPGEDVFDRLIPASCSKHVYLLFFCRFFTHFSIKFEKLGIAYFKLRILLNNLRHILTNRLVYCLLSKFFKKPIS